MLSPAILVAIIASLAYIVLENTSAESSQSSRDYLRKHLAT